ncbi:MAG: right-handed parallel beta-helix repeat-containing protein [Myxococcales bacterium]|nr:right-handed parallel beta-helix repeat-containing protein [Myxococcales bacterium]
MRTSVFASLRTWCLLVLGAALVVFLVGGPPASATPAIRNAWETFYGPIPIPGNADCQLCHGNTSVPEWNGYGWDIFDATGDLACDGADGSPMNGTLSLDEVFACVETDDSDFPGDPTGSDNVTEINAGAQPGWTTGPNNTIFTQVATILNQDPVQGLEPYDPDGAGGAGGMGGMGGTGGAGGDCQRDPIPPEQIGDGTITVTQGQSIQAALDQAEEDTRIEVEPGVYEEPCNVDNGLEITKNGIQLIGLSTAAAGPESLDEERVIVRSTGTQRNGIVIVPPEVPQAAQPKGVDSLHVERTDCMGCHTDMAPPFPLHPNVPKIIPKENEPWLSDIVIQGITIQGFENNGLFTEHVERFTFEDVESIDNRNYGIFPVLSRDGLIQNSYSTGSDLDSALWVETSERVRVINNLVEDSVNGIEVSNSDDVMVMGNESRNNTVGAAILLLPDIYPNRGSAKRINLMGNDIHDNNRENTARPGAILSGIPSGIGILYVGVDESVASGNTVENHDFVGIGVVDYCIPFDGDPMFDCEVDPDVMMAPGFLADQAAENNRIVGNIVLNNATNVKPDNPFKDFAGDLALLTAGPRGNCFADNDFDTFFSLAGTLPPCPEDPPGTGGAGGMGGVGGAGGDAGSGGTGGADADNGGGGCTVGSAAPSRPSATWLALLCCALALSLRRRLRRR